MREGSDADEAASRSGTDGRASEGTVRTNDIGTYYERGDGPPVVFVHGMAMSSLEWKPQMEALGDEYTTVACDVRGHGHTGGSERDP